MVISNEPGYYADGKFGIRIENIDVVKMSATPMNFGGKEFMELEHVTMVRAAQRLGEADIQVPIQTKLVETARLAPSERDWLNGYHAEVLEKVGPLLLEVGDTRAMAWLERECQAV